MFVRANSGGGSGDKIEVGTTVTPSSSSPIVIDTGLERVDVFGIARQQTDSASGSYSSITGQYVKTGVVDSNTVPVNTISNASAPSYGQISVSGGTVTIPFVNFGASKTLKWYAIQFA